MTGHALEADRLLIRPTGGPGPVPATTTDRSDEGHAEAAGSVESHIESPTPSLVVLHPGAPQRHSQIRSPRQMLGRRPRPSIYDVSCAGRFVVDRYLSATLLSRLLSMATPSEHGQQDESRGERVV